MARLLFLGASVSQLAAIRYAKEHGHFVVACDGDPEAVAFPLCDVAQVTSFVDVESVAAVAVRESVEGVLAICTDRAVLPAAEVAKRLGLPGLEPQVARAMTHKPTMRTRLDQCSIRQPPHRVLTRATDPATISWDFLPAVLKPADSGGQRGVTKVETIDELVKALPDALAQSHSGQAILERYIDGRELNTLFVVRAGVPSLLTISDRMRPPGQGFGVGWIHAYPSSLSVEQMRSVEQTAELAIRCLGMRDGIAFPQVLVDADGPAIVEVAARIAAGQMADLVRHGTGIELYEIAIRQAIGLPIPDALIEPKISRPVAIRFLTAAPGVLPVGTVRSIEGLDAVREAPGVLDAGLYFGPGTAIGPVRVDADRRGYVIATGETAADALVLADAATHRLRVSVREPDLGRSRTADRRRTSRRIPIRRAAAGRVLASLVCGALLVGTTVAFLVAEHAKLQRAVISGTHVDKTFSPTCRCAQNVAHIAFHLLRRTAIEVRMVSSSGVPVATLLRTRNLVPGLVHLTWRGRDQRNVPLPNGSYFPDVVVPSLHRNLELPSRIVLDDSRPSVVVAHASTKSLSVTVRYRFSEPAHALLLIDGRRAVLTRFAPTSGIVRFAGRFESGQKLRRAPRSISLVAIDLAGNASHPYRVGKQ